MDKATVIAVTAVVWTIGFGAAAALTYDVTRPLPQIAAREVNMPMPSRAEDKPAEEPRHFVLPTVEIITRAQLPTPAPARPAHHVHCSEWKPLQQGSSSVQICD
jgi:hypothetical protein